MFDRALLTPLRVSGAWQRLERDLAAGRLPVAVLEMPDGLKGLFLWALHAHLGRPVLVVVSGDVQAARLAEDTALISGLPVRVFASRPLTLSQASAASRDLVGRRIATLGAAMMGEAAVTVASVDALLPPLPPADVFRASCVTLEVGQQESLEGLVSRLSWSGYVREDRVEGPGQFAVRGGIVDVYPVTDEDAVRVEFFGDEIDSIRRFDADTQRSSDPVSQITLWPATESPLDASSLERGVARLRRELAETLRHLQRPSGEQHVSGFGVARAEDPAQRLRHWVGQIIENLATGKRAEGTEDLLPCFYKETCSLADYLANPVIVADETSRCIERYESLMSEFGAVYAQQRENGRALAFQAQLPALFPDLLHGWEKKTLIALQQVRREADITPRSVLRFPGRAVSVYRGQFELLRADVARWRKEGLRVALMAGGERRAIRMMETLTDYGISAIRLEYDRALEPGDVAVVPAAFGQGFESAELSLCIVGERELFGAARRQTRPRRRRSSADFLSDLSPGDMVVHEAHGVGRFEDVVKLTADGATRDYLKIYYRDDDVLYVPTEQMDRVQKYIGKEDSQPRLSRLGGREWASAKARVRRSIADIAEDLMRLYARRQMSSGHAFGPDTEWQRQFEEEFPWEETPDQLSAIEEIKADMESPRTMDRLLCGDVGYGKTEVALRAIFKAVMDGKQAALMAPTTILASQHYGTLTKRFEHFGVEAALLTRFQSPAEVAQQLERLRSGAVDVAVGTHRLLSEDVRFKDLGLLVVDEEQRFGVAHKERIKTLKESIDVLTLTATPIPRTLHMSMVGIRDISVIDTPPEERHPVQTIVIEYDESLIRDAILRELGRGGQVYFVYNRVETIEAMAAQLSQLVPEARIAVGHGQMREHQLEKVMMGFLEGETDLLLCTTIIENGLDIPRVNTLIVYDADHFGLSQLYQLRGRVGRSNRLAYAYLTWRRDKVISEVAEKRLSTIREFTEFGSGFRIALRDMEIRGAGNLLGAQQHGHMAAVGYGLYCKLIEETVRSLRGYEAPREIDPTLDVRVDAYIPEDYIPSSGDRLEIYRRMAAVDSEEARGDIVDEMIDRFGEPPECVMRLMDVALLRHRAARAGVDQVRQTGAEWRLRLTDGAGIEPAALIATLSRWNGRAVLSAGDRPSVRLRLTRDEADPMAAVGALLTAMADCVKRPGSEPAV
ncbi:MAG: transcription-repair coupling factor [Clostridiales bacterium]|nr:transcription-repair coupling factor [Clostridiales bacterium]